MESEESDETDYNDEDKFSSFEEYIEISNVSNIDVFEEIHNSENVLLNDDDDVNSEKEEYNILIILSMNTIPKIRKYQMEKDVLSFLTIFIDLKNIYKEIYIYIF